MMALLTLVYLHMTNPSQNWLYFVSQRYFFSLVAVYISYSFQLLHSETHILHATTFISFPRYIFPLSYLFKFPLLSIYCIRIFTFLTQLPLFCFPVILFSFIYEHIYPSLQFLHFDIHVLDLFPAIQYVSRSPCRLWTMISLSPPFTTCPPSSPLRTPFQNFL